MNAYEEFKSHIREIEMERDIYREKLIELLKEKFPRETETVQWVDEMVFIEIMRRKYLESGGK